MLKQSILTVIGACLALAISGQALAQDYPSNPQTPTTNDGRPAAERVLPGRIGSQDDEQQRNRNRNRSLRPAAPTPPTPEEAKAAAQAQAAAAGSTCQVSEASMLGVNAEQQPMYEAACAAGPGYILIASTPPQAVDCVILAGQADLDRQRNPAADTGIQCKLPANTDVARVVAAYAQEAGVTCTVDQGASIGKSTEGNFIYEVGCNGVDGYWIEKVAGGWEKTECLTVVTQSAACRFTTPQEQAATVKTRLAGSPAAACDVTEARYMGANTNGSFYEAKCATGDGYVARFNAEGAVQQTYPCAEAARIGGGCKLTTVGPAAPAAAGVPATEPAATPAPAIR